MSTNVELLAKAMLAKSLKPNFSTQYFQPAYLPSGQLSALPSYFYMDDAGAGQVASLLGGSVVKGQPPGGYNGTNIPDANWVRLADGQLILPGNLMPPGVILNFSDLCQAESMLAGEIPGGVTGPECANAAIPSWQAPQSSAGWEAPAVTTPVAISPLPFTAGAQQQQVSPNPASGAAGNVVTTTPGASVGQQQAGQQTGTQVATGFDLSAIPWWVWAGAVGAALWAMKR